MHACFLSTLDLDQYRELTALLAYFSSFITAIHQHTTCSRIDAPVIRVETLLMLSSYSANAGNTTQVLNYFRFLEIFLSFFGSR